MQFTPQTFSGTFSSAALYTTTYNGRNEEDDFYLMMASMKRAEDKQKARIAKVEEKWNILFNQKTRAPIYNVSQYIDYLKQYTAEKEHAFLLPEHTDNGQDGQIDGVRPVSYLLQKLKLDLKMSFQWFIEDFVRKPNDGLCLLVTLLKNIQKVQKDISSTPSKNKMKNRKRLLFDEHDCLTCVKFCLRVFDAGVILLDASYGLESVASALMSSHTKSRVVALEIMSLILKEPEGYQRNLDCFTYFRLKNGEPTRFKFLISMLMSRSTSSLAFQLCCMKFVNSLLAAAPTSNSRVFLQEELSMAGLEPNLLLSMIEDLNLPDKSTLTKEVLDYKNHTIDIDYMIEKQRFLQEQITRLSIELNGVRQPEGKAKSSKRRHAPLPPPTPSSTPVPPTPPPLPLTPHTVLPNREETLTPTPNNPGGMKNVSYSPIPDNAKMAACLAELKSRNIIRRYANKENIVSAEIHQFSTNNKTSAIVPIRNMPFLNWVPLANVEDTIFKSLNFERVLNEIELFDLEENFRIGKDNIQSKNDNFAAGLSPRGKDSKIRFMDSNRARNLSILQRRIGRSPEHIKQFIEEYDVDALLPDNAELLLKFVPTEEEMRTIMTLDFDFDDLGGAEQMLLQLMSIERLEDKLKLMLFMDHFSRTSENLYTPIEEIKQASSDISGCVKVRKVFEIVLALGNFINGNRKGHAVGFRVTSLPLLEEIRSSDKSKTLLAYVTEVVERHYFEVHDWYEDIDIQIPFKASYHAVLSTVKELREAMDILVREVGHAQCESARLTQFQREASEMMCLLESKFQEMEEAYKDVCTLFGESPVTMDSTEFFKMFFKFADSYRREDKLLFRKRWRQNVTQKLNSRKRCSTPTRDQNFDNRTIDLRDLPSSPTFDNVHEERLTPSSAVTIPAHYSKDYDVKSFSYDPYGVMMPSGHTTPQLPIVENWAVCSPHVPPIIPTPTETCVENWVLNRPSVAPLQTPTDTCVENWIVSSPPPEKCSDVLKEECQVKILQLEEEPCDDESIFDCDSESNDSAFVGSEGQHLKSSGSKSNELEEGYEKYGPESKTSAPDRRLIAQLPEPVPDYPADDIPADIKPSGDMDEEITKILNEFEGDLNGYCSGATTPSPRRFVTIRSIIYM